MSECPKYEIWIADLNSLWDDEPRPPVFCEDAWTEEGADKAVSELRGHDMAAWAIDKETRAVRPQPTT